MADRQLPVADEIFLDHIGHFVPDIDAAAHALKSCGFVTTPFAVQRAPTGPDGAMEPTGTGNVCAMLRAGYLEFLAKTADTPLAAELEAAIARWSGVHLAAFAVADPGKTHDRLVAAGVGMRPVVHLRRPVETAEGMSEARFTVLRPKPGEMAEGRMQLVTHHTEREVWQPRWLDHPNGVTGLLGLTIVSADPGEAAGRFERLLGVSPKPAAGGVLFALARGHVRLVTPDAAAPVFGAPPGLPWVAGYALQAASLEKVRETLGGAGVDLASQDRAVVCPFPPALGAGAWVFVEDAGELPWR